MVSNGEIPLTLLRKVDATHYAAPGCARAWKAFAGELGLTVGNATDAAYRSLAWQNYRWAIYRRNGRPVAAYPGTSNHGWGMAIDIGNYYRFSHSTLVRVGRRYGFRFDTRSEPWHVKYTGAPEYAAASGGGAQLLGADDSMAKLAIVADGGYKPYLVSLDNQTATGPLGPKTVEALRNGEDKHKGPLGDEFEWDKNDWARVRTYLNVQVAPPGMQS